MKRSGLILIAVVILLLVLVVPTSAASWSKKVTGGGQAASSGVNFSVTTSAWNDGNGYSSGQMQYSRYYQSVADLSMHGKVECFNVFNSGSVAVAVGPAKAQYDPSGVVFNSAWMVVEINEGGVGAGDRVRVRLLSEAAARSVCSNPSGLFPGLVYDGNFNIRSK